MSDNSQTSNLEQIVFQVEQLKSFHQGCLRLLERIQKEIRADIRKTNPPPRKDLPGGYGFELFGQWFQAISGTGILVGVLKQLSELDPGFPEQFARRLKSAGRTRAYIARKIEDLYPGRPSLAKYSAQFTNGWYVGTNESNQKKLQMLRIACEVIDIQYGIDLRIKMS